jgi:PKD repeat protein
MYFYFGFNKGKRHLSIQKLQFINRKEQFINLVWTLLGQSSIIVSMIKTQIFNHKQIDNMIQSIFKIKGIAVLLLLITMSSCDFFNGNGTSPTSTPKPKYSFEDDFFLEMRKENGILAFRNMKHLDQVYETLMKRNTKYLNEDSSEEEEVKEEMPYLAAFEKFTGVTTARQAANKRMAIYDEKGSEGKEKLEGHPFTDEVLATLFNKKNCIKVGCTYVYNPTYGGKQYAVTKNDDKLLADLVKMEPQSIDELLPRHPRAYRVISNANALSDAEFEEVFVGGCFPEGSRGGNSGGGPGDPGSTSSSCSNDISAFTITPNPPSLSDYTFTVTTVNPAYTYEWEYQENNNTVTLTGANASVSFQETRNYNVTLIVSNAAGQEIETCNKSVTVVGDCTLDVLSMRGAVQINDIVGSPGQITVMFNRSSIQAILNPGINISDVVFTVNGQQTTVTAANGYTMTYTAPCDGPVNISYTINYDNSGTPCPSISGTKTHTITTTSCCLFAATHTAGGSNQYLEMTFSNDKKISYRFCQIEKTFFPNKKGSKLMADMKYRTKNNQGNWVKKKKQKLKITFGGDVYGATGSGANAGCACQIPIPLSGEPSPSTESNIKRFSYAHNMKFQNKKVSVKQLSNSGNDGSWNVRFEAVGTNANTGALKIQVPQVVNGQNCN